MHGIPRKKGTRLAIALSAELAVARHAVFLGLIALALVSSVSRGNIINSQPSSATHPGVSVEKMVESTMSAAKRTSAKVEATANKRPRTEATLLHSPVDSDATSSGDEHASPKTVEKKVWGKAYFAHEAINEAGSRRKGEI
eukprot:3500605-Rhodomonas_salina.1